jgi:hypothetical protein
MSACPDRGASRPRELSLAPCTETQQYILHVIARHQILFLSSVPNVRGPNWLDRATLLTTAAPLRLIMGHEWDPSNTCLYALHVDMYSKIAVKLHLSPSR